MTRLLNFITDIYLKFRRYHIVAYNSRMYPGYRYVNSCIYTLIGAKLWLNEFADRTRYVYDLYDIRTGRLVYDYSKMFSDFESVKRIIRTTNGVRRDSVRRLIFNFKQKWTRVAGDQAASIYFADLMTIYNEQYIDYEFSE